jgi:hypothetical protein
MLGSDMLGPRIGGAIEDGRKAADESKAVSICI